MRYSIIIPCYNESKNINNLLLNIDKISSKYDIEFILVNNGSDDNTEEKLRNSIKDNKKIKYVRVEINRGYGYGILSGLKVSTGEYVGWIHADMQVPITTLKDFINIIEKEDKKKKLFIKGIRKNRGIVDQFFTVCMTIIETIIFQTYLYDIGGIPVLFHRSLLIEFDKAPYDFSLELFSYYKAKKNNFIIKRIPVQLFKREKGKSSWNRGFTSKIRQSIIIFKDSIAIRKGRQVL